jgi:hypothetical protein
VRVARYTRTFVQFLINDAGPTQGFEELLEYIWLVSHTAIPALRSSDPHPTA